MAQQVMFLGSCGDRTYSVKFGRDDIRQVSLDYLINELYFKRDILNKDIELGGMNLLFLSYDDIFSVFSTNKNSFRAFCNEKGLSGGSYKFTDIEQFIFKLCCKSTLISRTNLLMSLGVGFKYFDTVLEDLGIKPFVTFGNATYYLPDALERAFEFRNNERIPISKLAFTLGMSVRQIMHLAENGELQFKDTSTNNDYKRHYITRNIFDKYVGMHPYGYHSYLVAVERYEKTGKVCAKFKRTITLNYEGTVDAWLDLCDEHVLYERRWHVDANGYVVSSEDGITLQKFIMKDAQFVKRVNGVRFDNTRDNLVAMPDKTFTGDRRISGYCYQNNVFCVQTKDGLVIERTEKAACDLASKEYYGYDFLRDRRNDLDLLTLEYIGEKTQYEVTRLYLERYANAWYYYRYNLCNLYELYGLRKPQYGVDWFESTEGFMVDSEGVRLKPSRG